MALHLGGRQCYQASMALHLGAPKTLMLAAVDRMNAG